MPLLKGCRESHSEQRVTDGNLVGSKIHNQPHRLVEGTHTHTHIYIYITHTHIYIYITHTFIYKNIYHTHTYICTYSVYHTRIIFWDQ